MASDESPPARRRRPRYPGRNPRRFHEKYKELNPARYEADVRKIVDSGKTPAGMHRAIMVEEVLTVLAPKPGSIAVDCTLGFGGHARAILERIQPGGLLIGLDVDPLELPHTVERLRTAGFGQGTFRAHRRNFAGLPQVLAAEEVAGADLILADLGVSSMQLDNPDRGFTFKASGPLDMRMNPGRGEPASRFLAHQSESKVARLLRRERRRARRDRACPGAEVADDLDDRGSPCVRAGGHCCGTAEGDGGRHRKGRPPDLSGAADRGERRILRAGQLLTTVARLSCGRWTGSRADVSFGRGPPRQEGIRGRIP